MAVLLAGQRPRPGLSAADSVAPAGRGYRHRDVQVRPRDVRMAQGRPGGALGMIETKGLVPRPHDETEGVIGEPVTPTR